MEANEQEEHNLEVAVDVLEDYIWWHKGSGLGGLARCSKINVNQLNAIRYNDPEGISLGVVKKLINGLENIRKETNEKFDVLVAKLEAL